MKGKDDTGPTAAERLERAFIETDEMSEFLDAQSKALKAAERGDKEVSLPAALMDRVLAITQPMDLEHLRLRFNQLCDEMGMPAEKVPDPPPINYDPEKGPF